MALNNNKVRILGIFGLLIGILHISNTAYAQATSYESQRYICLFETKEPSRLYTAVINVSVPNDFLKKEKLLTQIEHSFAAHVTKKSNIADWVAMAAGQPVCRPSLPGRETDSLEYTVNYFHKFKPNTEVVNTDWVYAAK
jgi:hypothetical protein